MFKNKGPGLANNMFRRLSFPLLRRFGILNYPDAFMNYPLWRWQALFKDVFGGKLAYISFTGGEPLLHYKKMNDLIRTVSESSEDYRIRFDTNGSVIPVFSYEFHKKIAYVVSYHKSQARIDTFLKNLELLSKQGNVYMIQRIINSEMELEDAMNDMELFNSHGYYMNISPAFFTVENWSKGNVELLRKVTTDIDYELRIERKTKNKMCKYPEFGFRLLPNGYAEIYPCHNKVINLMKERSPNKLFTKGPMVCASRDCTCLHTYGFVAGIDRNAYSFDILGNFVEDNKAHRKDRR
jgi:organic radical activating enzyme